MSQSFRSDREVANDSSLFHRVRECVVTLMRAKGKYANRLVALAGQLEALRESDFPDAHIPTFRELKGLVEKHRTTVPTPFGHFSSPSPKDREKIARCTIELYDALKALRLKYRQ